MRGTLLLSVVALVSCSSGTDTFKVDDPNGLAKSAVLQLDGHEQPLEHDRKSFSTKRRIMRDADGRVRVLYTNGRTVDCPIGYVTPGAAQRWTFQLTPTACKPL